MDYLPYIWSEEKKWGFVNTVKDITVYTMDSVVSLKYLIKYLERYPLKSIKNIAYNKWLKLYRIIEDGGRCISYEEMEKRAKRVNDYGKEDIVQK
jgi:hypothetical protein